MFILKEIIEGLKEIVENPEDLSKIPEYIAKLEEHSKTYSDQEEAYQERIMKLQQANRNLLSQIPIPGAEPQNEEEDDKVTFEDAQQQLLKAMNNVGGN